jgi:hypothetical protein
LLSQKTIALRFRDDDVPKAWKPSYLAALDETPNRRDGTAQAVGGFWKLKGPRSVSGTAFFLRFQRERSHVFSFDREGMPDKIAG